MGNWVIVSKPFLPVSVSGGLTIYPSPCTFYCPACLCSEGASPCQWHATDKDFSPWSSPVSWAGMSFGLIKKIQRKDWFKCSSKQVSGKVAHESHVPFPNSLGWRRSLVLKLFDFNFIFTSVWILIAVAWNTSILIPGYTLCLVKNGDDNFPGNGQCFRPTALLKPWLPAVFQSCTVAFYKPWNTVCKSNHHPKLVITKVNDLFIRTSTLALPHAVN